MNMTYGYWAWQLTVYPKKYAHGVCFAVLCCGYTLTDFPMSIKLTSLALWKSNDCPSASKATLMNMDKYFMLIHYERLHNHNKAKHKNTVCIFLGIYCSSGAGHVASDMLSTASYPFVRWANILLTQACFILRLQRPMITLMKCLPYDFIMLHKQFLYVS